MRPTLRLLGGAAIEADGAVVAGPATHRHRLALLALLAASPRRTLSRDKLVGFLWPNHGQDDARHLLRQAVYVIRKDLGEGVLESAGEQITLDSDTLPSDLAEFEEALADGDLERAVGSYGGPFLDGFHLPGAEEFERWSDGERERLAGLHGEALKSLAEQAVANADWEAAGGWWGRLAAHDPYDSGVVLGLMQALARTGDRGGALRRAEEHAEFLERELGAPPDPQVTELAERLRADAPAAPGARPVSVPLPAAPPVRPVFRRRLWASVAGFAVVTTLLIWLGIDGSRAPSSEDRIAVLPFEVRGQQRLAYLREGMVDLLSSKVEGAGRLRSVDPRALLSFIDRRGPRGSSLDTGRAVARQFGAGRFVAGTVVAAGDRLEIHATVYDAEGNVRSRLPAVTGHEEELFDVVDRLARSVVASRYEAEGERLSRLAATTTASMPALRSWLSGETAFRAGRFDRAVEEFRRATREDSTFALAWYRLAVAEEWSLDLEAAEVAASRALRHGGRLAERDRRLLSAWQAYFSGRTAEAERLYRQLLEAHPEDVEAWYQLGEVRFHYGPRSGRSIAESREAFQRVIELEPDHEGALLHLARIAARFGRTGEIDSLAGRLRRFSPASELAVEMRALSAFARRDPAPREAVAAELGRLDDAAVLAAIWTVSYADPLGGIDRLAPILTRSDRPAEVRSTGHLLLATSAIARGRRGDADAALAAAGREDPGRALPFRGLYAALPFLRHRPVELEAIRTELEAWKTDSAPTADGRPVFLAVHDGLHAHVTAYVTSLVAEAAGDGEAATRALQDLERLAVQNRGRALARDLALGARAQLLAAADAVEGLAMLEQIGAEFPYERVVASPFFALSRERFLQAELLRRVGRHDEALRLYGSFVDVSLFDLPYLGPAHLARAEILDGRGEARAALHHYRRFVQLWRDADPEQRPVVERARARIAALTGPG